MHARPSRTTWIGRRSSLGLAAAMLLAIACRDDGAVPEDGAFLLHLLTAKGAPHPDELRVSVYDGGGVLWKKHRIPEQGVLPSPTSEAELGTLLIQPGAFEGDLRIHVRGLRTGKRVLDGHVKIDGRKRAGRARELELKLDAAQPADADGDDVPDAIDDCPGAANPDQGGCPGTGRPDAGGMAGSIWDAGLDGQGSDATPVTTPDAGTAGAPGTDAAVGTGGAAVNGTGGNGGGGSTGNGGAIGSGGVVGSGGTSGDGGARGTAGMDGRGGGGLTGGTGGTAGRAGTGGAGTGGTGARGGSPGSGGSAGRGVGGGPSGATGGAGAVPGTGGRPNGTGGVGTGGQPGGTGGHRGGAGGVTVPPRPNGAACDVAAQCRSGFCIEGVCCERECEVCETCTMPGSVGRCHARNRLSQVSSVGGTASCAGLFACDGAGQCRMNQGTPCGGGNDCASGFCADGVCCDSACDDICEACTTGSCLPIVGIPDPPRCTGLRVCEGRGQCVGLVQSGGATKQ